MNTTIIKKPFIHSLTDDFLSEEDFNFLLEYITIRKEEFFDRSKHYTESFDHHTVTIETNPMKKELMRRLFPYCSIIMNKIFEPINFPNKKYETLREQIELYNWGMNGNDFENIHVDDYDKIVSCVLYVYPEKQTGTYIYDKDSVESNDVNWEDNHTKEFITVVLRGEEVEWKQNRLFSMVSCGNSELGKTYHCVRNNYGTSRVTVNFLNWKSGGNWIYSEDK